MIESVFVLVFGKWGVSKIRLLRKEHQPERGETCSD